MHRTANRLIVAIVIAMVLGVGLGYACHVYAADAAEASKIADVFQIITDVFLRLIKMIIAPLVFSTLTSGIAHMGHASTLGRLGGQAIAWFVVAGLVSLTLGLIMVHLFEPGVGFHLPMPDASALQASSAVPTLHKFIVELVPQSVFAALAENHILQIVVFSVFAGAGLSAIGEAGAPLLRGIDALAQLTLKITDYVMSTAPVAVAAALAAVVTTQGLEILQTFGVLIAEFYLSLAILLSLISTAGAVVLGRQMWPLLRHIRVPALLAFSTASSEAAFPQMLEKLEEFGVPRRVSSFVLPLGYSFNLDGSMMYCTFASLFVVQVYGIDLSLGEQIYMLLLLMVMSKGIAGVPRAALVVVAAVLPHFGIPEQGVLLLLGVDQVLDMGRTATNVFGNAVASAVVSKWDGALEDGAPPAPTA